MRTRRSNLALVGLPGVGKSSLGRRLASQLNVPLLDLDRSIIASTGVAKDSVEGIFAREGEAGFRIRERSAVAALDEVTPPAGGAAAALGIGRIVALGGDSLEEIRANLDALRARAATPRSAPVAGGAHDPETDASGTSAAGSGGDD